MKRRAIPAISLALVVLFSASFLLALPGAVSMPASAVTQAENFTQMRRFLVLFMKGDKVIRPGLVLT